ncbi:Acylphosphatase [Thalassoporum mexicanum PCC 7367]|uniref:acylphosphatase n=1 Tax=Thalassoporum mexicanum TaxID=3457544 RepID=UPI00029FF519|nr:acylphosphatase [Pseudanabaena sp. PCC 7367]AFY70906.1 Acylphosphatase [Pseudanabaena sp. PCC 7367]
MGDHQKQVQKQIRLIRVHLFISGNVQGVGYRFSTASMAKKLGLAGWVRNLLDGRVEATFEGAKETVEKMLSWCYQGPDYAIVKDITIAHEQPLGLKGFEIKY